MIQYCEDTIDYKLKGKSFLDYANSFFPNKFEENDKIRLKFFQ